MPRGPRSYRRRSEKRPVGRGGIPVWEWLGALGSLRAGVGETGVCSCRHCLINVPPFS